MTPTLAANAYASVQRLTGSNPLGGADKTAASAKPDFASMVADATQAIVDQGRATEGKEVGMLQNKADVVDVVTAVAETELAMETIVSVRDKVIAAYQQIMQMPI